MTGRTISWRWQGRPVEIGIDEAGEGPLLLLLPALSSISTRAEMHPLMQRLSDRFRVVTLDWPGFGTAPRPPVQWTPDALCEFLRHALATRDMRPHGVVAAGHAAAYVLHHAARNRGSVERIALIAPTWRGPLPTMMNGQRPWFAKARRLIECPVIGPPLYRANVSAFVVRRMVAGHVYSDPAFLDAARLAEKLAVTRAPGARFASVAFVTGALDRYADRASFLADAAAAGAPILSIYGAETPKRSRAEMEALARCSGVKSICLPRGKLSVHEEFPDEVAATLRPFLAS
jgi:pimeloyl-ACP methyl ester carboxylesterase